MSACCANRNRSPYETGRPGAASSPGSLGDARVFRPGGIELTARAVALAQLAAGATILDLGCGAGDTTRWLRAQGFNAIGVDCAPNGETSMVASAEALPLADSSTDAVLAECSFSLFEDPARALAECARVLIDGGRFIISDLYARHPEAIAEVRSLPGSCASGMLVREELEASLSNAAFIVNVWEDHSRALRECAARFLFEQGSLDGLWGCGGDSSAIQSAMRTARAGYFLLIATRRNRSNENGKGSDE
ncbi:MAG TPA: class I SAM-dependent methyltransferase [Acidobacteriaceae bacterium]|jgi:SAM-dependent methyltransferase|nr:class I SAM-dependent methyltransferase [Acidobacteriaceae bacterium]